MSVTIYPTQPNTLRRFPSTRRELGPCEACCGGYCQPGWCADGVEFVDEPSAPECNVANEDARALLTALGLDAGSDLCGAIDSHEVAGLILECHAALAGDVDGMCLRAPMLRDGESGTRFVVAATDDARARVRVEALLRVCEWAQQRGTGLAWS